MTLCESLNGATGHKTGLYRINGDYVEGINPGFKDTSDKLISDGMTYISANGYIICVDAEVSDESVNLIRVIGNLMLKKVEDETVKGLDYILKHDIPRDKLKGKYSGSTVFYIKNGAKVVDFIKGVYENCNIEIVKDKESLYLVKKSDDDEQEAMSIVNDIKQESNVDIIIGCGRLVSGSYTVKDSAEHAKEACRLAANLGYTKGFYHIDSMAVYGLIYSVADEKIEFYLRGGYSGFNEVVRDKELINTAEELFTWHLNISEAARRLYLHRNTLLYRVEKIKTLTGLDIKKFEEAVIFRTVVTIYKFRKNA